MSASWKIANVIVLPVTLALASVGCAVPLEEDASDTEAMVVADSEQAMSDASDTEAVGTAEQACGFGGGFGGYGGWGGGFGGGFRPWSGCGGFGLGRPFWGGGGGGCW